MKKYLKSILIPIIIFLIYLFIISGIYYFEILNYKIINIINYVMILLLFFILGYKISKIHKKKGYLNGFAIGVIIVIIFTFISLIITKLEFSSLVYYLSLIISSMIGGIVGVK